MTSAPATPQHPERPDASNIFLEVSDFRKAFARQRVRCFLCGPGEGAGGYGMRAKLAKHMREGCCVEVKFGEDLPSEMKRQKRSRSSTLDLQTLESDYARSVDFTILMLESPGAIAELGSFCMIPEIRCHLYVIVPARFHRSDSYIARGPLDLLARAHSASVMYYQEQSEYELKRLIAYPVMLHKYAARQHPLEYTWGQLLLGDGRKNLPEVMERIRAEFLPQYVAATIAILGEACFAEIVSTIGIAPSELRASLKRLFDESVIRKPRGCYSLKNGFRSSMFDVFKTGALSKKRCVRLATNQDLRSGLPRRTL